MNLCLHLSICKMGAMISVQFLVTNQSNRSSASTAEVRALGCQSGTVTSSEVGWSLHPRESLGWSRCQG